MNLYRPLAALVAVLTAGGAAIAQTAPPPTESPAPIEKPIPYYYTTLFGTVTHVGASSITVAPPTGTAIDVTVDASTQYLRVDDVDIAGLRPGDWISVNGAPKGIVAEQIQAGDNVLGGSKKPVTKPSDGGAPPAPVAYRSSSAYASGAVASVNLTSRIVLLTLDDGSSLSVDVPAGVKVRLTRGIDLSSVKVGDPIFASGSTGVETAGGSPGATGGGSGSTAGGGSGPVAGDGSGNGSKPAPDGGPTPWPPVPIGPFTASYVEVGNGVAGAVGIGVPILVGGGTTGSGGGMTVPPPLPPSDQGTAAAHAPAVRGNLTGSGRLGVADATVALRIAVGLADATPAQLAAGDLFHEGRITLRDATAILHAAVFGVAL